MSLRRHVLWLIAMLYACCSLGQTQDDQLKVATGKDYPPFISERFPQGGWSQAIVAKVFEHMGRDIAVDILPWDRALMWAGQNQYLGIYPYVYSDARAAQFLYSDPINYFPIRLYVTKASGITRLEQLNGARFCLPYGYNLGHSDDSLYSQLHWKVSHAADIQGCQLQVQKGWSDASLFNGYMQLDSIENNNVELVVLDQDLGTVALHFLIAKSYPDASQWMQKFNVALAAITASGERAKIDRHFKQILSELN
ncbi:substrate-binding periplasmic protein [Neptunicella sp.]|uniref:substrate-binding periplasmic protein n=1 Tax=Neptunicella sp. TaxID=2125986 RepID=UPI003F68D434